MLAFCLLDLLIGILVVEYSSLFLVLREGASGVQRRSQMNSHHFKEIRTSSY